jgi:hypothetical protein
MKANIKRKQIIASLEYAGLSYLPNLLRTKQLKVIDIEFFKALNADINKLHSTIKSTKTAFDILHDTFVDLSKEKEKLEKQLREANDFLMAQNIVHPCIDKLQQDTILRELEKNKLISEMFEINPTFNPINPLTASTISGEGKE